MEIQFIALTYEESRLDFFEQQKKLHQQKLYWWKHQKPNKKYSSITIHDKCSYHGEAVQYYDDAIKALKGKPVRHGKWVLCEGFRICNGCGASPADWEPKPNNPLGLPPYCHSCGAKMDLEG